MRYAYLIILSVLCILSFPGCGKVDVDKLVEKLASKDEDERSKAKDQLAEVGPEAVRRLIELIEEADLMDETEQCIAGVDILAVIGEKYSDDLRAADITRVAKALVKLITERGTDNQLRIKPKDDTLLAATINALGKYPDAVTPEPLILALRQENKEVKGKGALWEKASKALAQTGSIAAKPLVRALKEAEAAVKFTTESKNEEESSHAKTNKTKSEKEKEGEAGNAGKTTPEDDFLTHIEDAISKLSVRLVEQIVDKTKKLELRLNAVEALSVVGGSKIPDINKVKSLIPTMEDKTQDIRLRRGIAIVLAQLDTANIEQIKGSLTKAMGDPDNVISLKAAESLCKAGNSAAINYLVNLLKDKDQNIRVPATDSLGIGESAARYIADKLKDEDKSVRIGVAQALGNIGSAHTDVGEEKIVAPLLKAIEDIEDDVRIAVVQALGKIASVKALKPLIESLDDENEIVRSYAKWGIEQIAYRERKEGISESAAARSVLESQHSKGEAANQPKQEQQWRSSYVVPVLNATVIIGREDQADIDTITAAGAKVYAELGPGLKKEYYEKALATELRERGKKVEVGKTFPVSYGGVELGEQRVGMIISNPRKSEDYKENNGKHGEFTPQDTQGRIMLGIEVAHELTSAHEAQLASYMKLAGISDGLLMNFGAESFESKTAGASGVAIGPEYLYMVAELLGKVGDERSIKPLITILKSEPDLDEASPQLRERSAWALGEIITRISSNRRLRGLNENFLNRDEGIECLKNILKELKPDADSEAAYKTACTKTREQAAIALGKIGDVDSVELLNNVLVSDDDKSVRVAASLALCSLVQNITQAKAQKPSSEQPESRIENIDQATLVELLAATPITKQLESEDVETKETAEEIYKQVTGKDPSDLLKQDTDE